MKFLAFIIVFDMFLLMTTDVGDEQEELLSRILLPSRPNLATLNCSAYGGPEDASEMVYWHDIPEDDTFMDPIDPSEEKKYLSFELDKGESVLEKYRYVLFTRNCSEEGGRPHARGAKPVATLALPY